jgi:hypothetical protein
MRWTALATALGLTMAPAFAQSVDLTGRWRSAPGQELEFKPNGDLVMVGIGTARYQKCGQGGTDVCVTMGRFQCRYRTSYNEANRTLNLSTGRPTINCPVGFFQREETNGGPAASRS